ncbi:MAG: hypothetical protein H7829_08785 [Magnetococcus sp. THC-1_WYH]
MLLTLLLTLLLTFTRPIPYAFFFALFVFAKKNAQGARLGLPFFAVSAKKGKHNAMLKVLKHGIMRPIFRKNREK